MSSQPQPTFDPGLTQKYTGRLKRAINDDGQFNVQRHGLTLRDVHPYLLLTSVPFPVFIAIVFALFLVMNLVFAGLYMAIGVEHLKGAEAATTSGQFLNAFFFSTHTLTTVGYGNIYPVGAAANSLAAIEALAGLLALAIATGLLFGRFSRPTARIGFSKNMLIAPYCDGVSLQFRIVNRRSNNLLELNTRVLLMTVEGTPERLERKFVELELERQQVMFFPLTWTVVHPITVKSPLHGKTREELETLQAEFMILVKAFDETFGQPVNVRRSYLHSELVWGGKFTQAFEVDPVGNLRLEVDRVSNFEASQEIRELR